MNATVSKLHTAASSLSAALAKAADVAAGDILEIAVDLIDAEEQVRDQFDEASLLELAAEMKTPRRETIAPILLRPGRVPGRFLLVYGERRWRSTKLAALPTVRAVVRHLTDQEAEDVQFAENIQREDLSPAAEARHIRKRYDRHQAAGVTAIVERIAAEVNKSKGWVSKRLALSDPKLNQNVRTLMENGVTEDFELLGALQKVYELNWSAGFNLSELVRHGKADRAKVRQELADLKAKKKEREEKEAAAAGKPAKKPKKPAPPKEEPFTPEGALEKLYGMLFEPSPKNPKPPRGVAGEYLASLTADQGRAIDNLLAGFHARGPQIAAGGPAGMIRALVASVNDSDWDDPDPKKLILGDFQLRPFTLGALLMGAAGQAYTIEALIDTVAPEDLITKRKK